MPTVHLPDGRTVHFPDTMPSDEIASAVSRLSPVDGGPETYSEGFNASLKDTASRAWSGIKTGAAATLNPLNLVRGPYELAKDVLTNRGENTIEGLKAIASGDPEAGGEAIGGLLTGAMLGRVVPKVVPKVVRGIRRAAPLAGAAAEGAAANIPFVSAPVRGAYRGMRGALDERAIASIDDPANLARAHAAVASARGAAASPMAEGFDPYMPNTPAPNVAEFGPAASADVPRVPQGTFAKLPDESWGITGENLAEGGQAHVINRGGAGRMMTVDKILGTTKEGKQLASIKALVAALEDQPAAASTQAAPALTDLRFAHTPDQLSQALDQLRAAMRTTRLRDWHQLNESMKGPR